MIKLLFFDRSCLVISKQKVVNGIIIYIEEFDLLLVHWVQQLSVFYSSRKSVHNVICPIYPYFIIHSLFVNKFKLLVYVAILISSYFVLNASESLCLVFIEKTCSFSFCEKVLSELFIAICNYYHMASVFVAFINVN